MGDIATHWPVLIEVIVLGLFAGVAGGLLGVGGSVIMIPGLTLLLGPNQHVYQAAAMIANVAVSVPAARRHCQAGMLVPRALQWMAPAAVACIFIGVWLSNLEVFAPAGPGGQGNGEVWLRRLFAAFLIYVTVLNVWRLWQPRMSRNAADWKLTPWRGLTVGSVLGTIAGLLGVGGGAIAVPLQQVLMRMPLRNCIANSATVICITATLGALYKNLSLVPDQRWHSLTLALAMAPTCVLGGYWGGYLTHRLPVRQVRVVFIIMLLAAAVRMADIPWLNLTG